MAYFEWDISLSVGISDIDDQHKKLISMISSLNAAVQEGHGRELMSEMVHGLIEYASTHFRTEEAYMSRFGYPDYEAHEAEHDSFISRVLDFQKKMSAEAEIDPPALLDFMKSWLVRHIQGTDMKYSEFFRQKGLR
jgi:hemerythrin